MDTSDPLPFCEPLISHDGTPYSMAIKEEPVDLYPERPSWTALIDDPAITKEEVDASGLNKSIGVDLKKVKKENESNGSSPLAQDDVKDWRDLETVAGEVVQDESDIDNATIKNEIKSDTNDNVPVKSPLKSPLKTRRKSKKKIKKKSKKICKKCGKDGQICCNECRKSTVKSTNRVVKPIEEGPFECNKCGKFYKDKNYLRKHKKHHMIDPADFKCDECGKCFMGKQVLRLHKQTHLKPEFLCPICGYCTNTRRKHLRHSLLHSETPLYKCDYCEKTFKTADCFKAHKFVHTEARPFLCDICAKSFKQAKVLRQHIKATHSSMESSSERRPSRAGKESQDKPRKIRQKKTGIQQCKICLKEFLSFGPYQHHMKTHKPIKEQCEICLSIFLDRRMLDRHMLIHFKSKPHVCHICNKAYRQKYDLSKHLSKIHPEEIDLPFECKFCDAKFKLEAFYDQHVSKKHSAEQMLDPSFV